MRSEHTEKVQYVKEVALSGHPPIGDFSFTKPLSMEFLGHHYEVTHWRDVLVKVAEVLSATHPQEFGRLAAQHPRFLRTASCGGRSKRVPGTGFYIYVNLNVFTLTSHVMWLLTRFDLGGRDLVVTCHWECEIEPPSSGAGCEVRPREFRGT